MEDHRHGEAVNEKAQNRKRQRQVEDQRLNDLVIRTLLSEPNGRRFLWNLLSECNIFRQTVSFGPGGFAATAFNEGRRSIGLRLLADINRISPNGYMKMASESSGLDLESEDARSSPSADHSGNGADDPDA